MSVGRAEELRPSELPGADPAASCRYRFDMKNMLRRAVWATVFTQGCTFVFGFKLVVVRKDVGDEGGGRLLWSVFRKMQSIEA